MLTLDTDVLVHWVNADCEHHEAVVAMIAEHVGNADEQLALVPQVCWEFLHVATDARRFDRPLTMQQAIGRVRAWWDAPETARITHDASLLHRTLELMESHALGRKRILDCVLAASLEGAGIRRLATLNGADFGVFGFLEIVDPRRVG